MMSVNVEPRRPNPREAPPVKVPKIPSSSSGSMGSSGASTSVGYSMRGSGITSSTGGASAASSR